MVSTLATHPGTAWFTREPEPKIDLEESPALTDEALLLGSRPRRPKPPRHRPLLYLVVGLVLVAAISVAMDPGMVMGLLGFPGSSETPSELTPPLADPVHTAASPDPVESSVPQLLASAPSPPYGEGQRVSIIPDPASSGISVLARDPRGSEPASTVRAGSVLTVMDTELQNTGWIHQVRVEDGSIGWIAEQRLTSHP